MKKDTAEHTGTSYADLACLFLTKYADLACSISLIAIHSQPYFKIFLTLTSWLGHLALHLWLFIFVNPKISKGTHNLEPGK